MTSKAYQTDRHTELRIHLLRIGVSQRQIAIRLGVCFQQLNQVLLDKRPGRELRRRLVEEIGLPADLVGYKPEEHAA